MPVPQYPDKTPKSRTHVTPWQFALYLKEQGKGLRYPLPWTMLIIYSNALLDELEQPRNVRRRIGVAY